MPTANGTLPRADTGPVPGGIATAPRPDPKVEYLAGGAGYEYPLPGQQELSHAIDDLSRDLGWKVYEAMRHDPTVAGVLSLLAMGALAGEFQVMPNARFRESPGEDESDPARKADIAKAAGWADAFRRCVDGLATTPKQISRAFLEALPHGNKLAEKVYRPGSGDDGDKLMLASIRTKPIRSWAFVAGPAGDVLAIRATSVDGGVVDLPPAKFVVATWDAPDGDPRGRSILRPAYNGWNLKINVFPKYYKFLDKCATPVAVATAAPDALDEREKDAAGNYTGRQWSPTEDMAWQLARLQGNGSYMALPAGATFQWQTPPGSGDQFTAAIDLFSREIVTAVISNPRSMTEAQHGSKADASESGDMLSRPVAYVREWLEDLWEDQVAHPWIELNAGREEADRFTPEVTFGKLGPEDIVRLAPALAQLLPLASPSQKPAMWAMAGIAPPRPEEVKADAEAAQAGLEMAKAGADAAKNPPDPGVKPGEKPKPPAPPPTN